MERPLAFVIEDQPNLLMLYEDALRLVGYDVIPIKNGLDAITRIEIAERLPSFVILDINLPGLSGRDVLKHIRKQARFTELPVLITTANTVMANIMAEELGKNDYLYIKPIPMKQLQDLARVLKPGKDGVPNYRADTQKIPYIDDETQTSTIGDETQRLPNMQLIEKALEAEDIIALGEMETKPNTSLPTLDIAGDEDNTSTVIGIPTKPPTTTLVNEATEKAVVPPLDSDKTIPIVAPPTKTEE